MSEKKAVRYRKIVHLRQSKKMTFEDIGQELGITRQRAHELYHRAVKLFRKTDLSSAKTA